MKDELSELCAKVLIQQIRDSRVLAKVAAESLAHHPTAGSARARFTDWIESEKRTRSSRGRQAIAVLAEESVKDVTALVASAYDHAEALRAVIQNPVGLMVSPSTLARGLLEAVLQICFIADPYVAPKITALRCLAFRLGMVEGNESTMNLLGSVSSEQATRINGAVDGLHAWCRRAGFTLEPARNPRLTKSVALEGQRVNIEFNATSATSRYLPDADYAYAMMSGATHSRGWFITGMYGHGEPGEATLGQAHLSATLMVTFAADALTRTLGMQLGIPIDDALRKTDMRRRGLVFKTGWTPPPP
jgi:hypothetical protein